MPSQSPPTIDPSALVRLRPEPLSTDAFAPFGDVIAPRPAGDPAAFPINGGMVTRHHDLATVELGGGRALINLFEARPYTFPMEISMMERHPLGSQAFIPLSERPFVVVVAPPGDALLPASLRAFITNGRQGVNYRAGVWHHMLLALGEPSFFAVVDRGGDGNNCDERRLAQPLLIELPGSAQDT